MDRDKISKEVKAVISKYNGFSPDKICMSDSIRTDLCLDDMGIIEISFDIEKNFGCYISDNEFDLINTVEDLVDVIYQKRTF